MLKGTDKLTPAHEALGVVLFFFVVLGSLRAYDWCFH